VHSLESSISGILASEVEAIVISRSGNQTDCRILADLFSCLPYFVPTEHLALLGKKDTPRYNMRPLPDYRIPLQMASFSSSVSAVASSSRSTITSAPRTRLHCSPRCTGRALHTTPPRLAKVKSHYEALSLQKNATKQQVKARFYEVSQVYLVCPRQMLMSRSCRRNTIPIRLEETRTDS
jgi:hypothetical protein